MTPQINEKNLELKKTILVVIDVINHCCHSKNEIAEWGLVYRKIRKIIPILKSFISRYKKLTNQSVVYIKSVKWSKNSVAPNIRKLYGDPHCDYYTKDKTNFSEQFYLLKPKKDDIVITKNSYDAFTNSSLNKLLKRKRISNIVIVGVLGDVCVNATIQSGFSLGYNYIILTDLIETVDNEERQQLLKLLKRHTWPLLYGQTINSRQLIQVLEKKK